MAPTPPEAEFQYRASRIASFVEGTKLGNTKSLKFWSNSSLSPDHLADCGFHYTPTKTYPDQVTCFWCGKKERNLDNVTSVSEHHLKNWPKCPYSRIVSNLEHFVKDSDKENFWSRLRDQGAPTAVTEPHSTSSISLRLATFKNLWKFDNKRRSKIKVTSRGLAEAGFYYSPVDQDDDRVICMYCDCPLSDWVLDDDPMAEHEKNSFVFCYFLHTLHNPDQPEDVPKKEALPLSDKLEENGSTTQPAPQQSNVPDLDLNEEPVNESDDINSSIPSIADVKHQTSFDAFDFSIEDLEKNDQATIFHGQNMLPKRFTRKRKQEILDEQEKKRSASEKSPSFNTSKSTSLALNVRDESEIDEPSVSVEDVDDYEHEDATDFSVIENTLLSSTSGNDALDPEDEDYTESSAIGTNVAESDRSQLGAVSSTKKTPKKTSKSQFSDDEFDLNSHDIDAILNSPKKNRKMKVIKHGDASPLPSEIYDLSNQNIGDYDEKNISYLEEHARLKSSRNLLLKSDATTHTVVAADTNSDEKSAPPMPSNSSILIGTEADIPDQIGAQSNSILIVDSSPQNSARQSDLTALELAPQSSPKEASLNLSRQSDPSPLEVGIEDALGPTTDSQPVSPVTPHVDLKSDLNRARELKTDSSNVISMSINGTDKKDVSSSFGPDLPGENSHFKTTNTSIESNSESPKEATKNEDKMVSRSNLSSEIFEDAVETELVDKSLTSGGSRSPSREIEDKSDEINVSPSSYEEYKRELLVMESELIETSSPVQAEVADPEQVSATEMDVGSIEQQHINIDVGPEHRVPGNESSKKRSGDDISRIEESASEDPQIIPVNTSLLRKEDASDLSEANKSPMASDHKESGPTEATSVAETPPESKTASPAQKSQPLTGTRAIDEIKEPLSQVELSANVERTEAISPTQKLDLPLQVESEDRPPKDAEAKALDRLSFLDVEASTPEKKKDVGLTGILSKGFLEKALQEIQVLEETIEYLVEVSGTEQELHNDVEGLLTEFIAAMPEEEESMSISQWIAHNAATCRRNIEETGQHIIQGYVEEFDKVIAHVESLETTD